MLGVVNHPNLQFLRSYFFLVLFKFNANRIPEEMKFNLLLQVAVLMLIVYLSGCTTSPAKYDKELTNLISAYLKYDKEMKNKRAERRGRGIKTLTVDKLASPLVVTADLEKASIPEVVRRIFEASGKRFSFDEVKTYGNITANFENLPLLEALNLILKPNLLTAEQQDDIIVVKNDVKEESSTVDLEVALENIDLETAKKFMGMFSEDLKYGTVASSNTIYLRGTKSEVSKVSQFLLKVDQEIPHVVIEVLIVEFNAGELEKLGARLEDLQNGKYGGMNLNYGETSNIIQFSKIAEAGEYANFLSCQ